MWDSFLFLVAKIAIGGCLLPNASALMKGDFEHYLIRHRLTKLQIGQCFNFVCISLKLIYIYIYISLFI